ncbi:uncharacterized protein LOC119070572 isoform X2 [Bradysia coprophila]|uniref:uncharacterized protein LOC119070572 isoform X2 n=1 Tax=Bradysia coprophila TaxID=38358 RepID=UPI00187DA2DF|nr:uncharacterized protein LOC119070572 isoform X2 [Bradysia coprophila]
MNVSVKKFLIAAFVAFYLCCESSAAAIGAEEATIEGAEPAVIGGEATGEGTPESEAETPLAAEAAIFKCGNLDYPNGIVCEIKEIPSDDEKTITKTTRCLDADGNVLGEETTTEDVAEGEIPFMSFSKKVVKTGKNGAFFGSSFAGSYSHGNVGPILHGNAGEDVEESFTDFDFGGEKGNIGSVFDDIMSAQRRIITSTTQGISDMMKTIFGKRWW